MSGKVAHDLKEIDEGILTVLARGRNVPSNLAEELDVSRQWINQRLQQMESADYVTNVGRGVYELQPENVPADDLDRLGIDHGPTVAVILEGNVGDWVKAWVIYPGAEADPGGPPDDHYIQATALPESDVEEYIAEHGVDDVERVQGDGDGA